MKTILSKQKQKLSIFPLIFEREKNPPQIAVLCVLASAIMGGCLASYST